MAPLGLSLVFFVAAVLGALVGASAKRPLLVGVCKPAATVFLLAVLGGLPTTWFGYLVLNAVVLSLAADIAHLAEGSEALVVGMGLSLVANLCLALAFIGLGLQAWSSLPGLLVFGTASVWLGGRLWPRVNPGLRGPLAANLVALSCMAAAVYSGLSGHMLLELAVVAALGATLLYFSHALLAWSRFRAPLAHAQALVLTSYWAGQLCIVLAARWGAGA